jgi:hypothetical protein
MKRFFIGVLGMALTATAADNLALPSAWEFVPNIVSEQKDGVTTLSTRNGEYGEYRQFLPIAESFPRKVKISFLYSTPAGQAANASFAFSWAFLGDDGKPMAGHSTYNRLTAASNGKRMLFSAETPPRAAKLMVKFQPQGPVEKKFIPSSVRVSKFTVASGGPSPEALKLIAAPLTQSDKVKRWPEKPLRGLGIISVRPTAYNMQDPGEFVSEDDFKKMAQWGVDSLRAEVRCDEGNAWEKLKPGDKIPPIPEGDPMAPYRKRLDGLRLVLNLAEKYGMQVILQCDPVGRRIDVMYQEGDLGGWENELIKMWKYVAKEFGRHPNLLGYDLLNEPNGKELVAGRWREVTLPQVVDAVRAIDRNTYLVVEPGPWGLPEGLENFRPLDDPKVVYSFHHYMPHSYTHQGLHKYKGTNYEKKPYPGILTAFGNPGTHFNWDIHALEKSIQAAIDFKKSTGAPMYVGEFSVIRWAPGGAQWLRDSIALFEKHGMSWSFHGYSGWNGWNPTFGADDEEGQDSDGGKVTDRLTALLEGWQKNKR